MVESVATYVILTLLHLLEIHSVRREQFSSPSRDRVGGKRQGSGALSPAGAGPTELHHQGQAHGKGRYEEKLHCWTVLSGRVVVCIQE